MTGQATERQLHGVEMRHLVAPRLRILTRVIGRLFRRPSQARIELPGSEAEVERREDGTAVHAALHAMRPPSHEALPLDEPQTEKMAHALETFASYSRCFTLGEFVDWLDIDVDGGEVKQRLLADPRFVWLGPETHDDYFIPESALFQWWSYLSLRLAEAQVARLTSRQLAMAMTSLRLYGRWDAPPAQAVQFGQSFGFTAPAWTSNEHVFPLARILSFLSPGKQVVAAGAPSSVAKLLDELWVKELVDSVLKHTPEYWLKEALSKLDSKLDKRVVPIAEERDGVFSGNKKTLEQIGIELGITRERVRQLEAKFWKRVYHPSKRLPFLKALLCDIMSQHGSVVGNVDSPSSSVRQFIAKCAGVPSVELPELGLVILGAASEDMPTLEFSWQSTDRVNLEAIAHHIEAEGRLNLIASDVRILAEKLLQPSLKRLNKAQKVYLALRAIRRPAHYSEVAAEYNQQFPDDPSSEHNIHAALLREQHGVVWIGAKGMFALEEWGYKRPSIGLFDAVTKIVAEKFQETEKPVPFTVIMAEIGKYRQFVTSSSLVFATQLNPDLERVSNDYFIPKEHGEDILKEISADELDRILHNFEQTLQP